MLGELVWVRMVSMVSPLLRWWLVLFIHALVLFPNIEREGIPQRPICKGQLVQLILTKVVFACQRLCGDAVVGSGVTSALPSCWSWSCCTDMETFA